MTACASKDFESPRRRAALDRNRLSSDSENGASTAALRGRQAKPQEKRDARHRDRDHDHIAANRDAEALGRSAHAANPSPASTRSRLQRTS